jgi:hypothetical protein
MRLYQIDKSLVCLQSERRTGLRSRRGVLDTTLCDKVCQKLATGLWFSPGTPVSSTNKADRHDITEILNILLAFVGIVHMGITVEAQQGVT